MSLSPKQKYTKQPSSIYLTNIKSTQIGFSLLGSALMTSTNYYSKPINQIPLIYNQLHKWIDTLQDKVKVLLEKQSAQMQFAYKNHLVQLKKQLCQLKARSQQQEKSYSENTKIQYLQRQMILFREEALKCSQQLQNSKQNAQKLKFLLSFANKQILQKNEQIKRLIRITKGQQIQLEGSKQLDINTTKKEPISQISIKSLQINKFNKTSSDLSTQLKNSINTPSNRNTFQKPKNIEILQKININQQQNSIRISQNATKNNHYLVKKRFSYNKTKESQQQVPMPLIRKYNNFGVVSEFQVQDWFLECVRSVRNDITYRKFSHNSTNNPTLYSWMKNINNIDDFKATDKHRILQMFVNNDTIIQLIYSKLKKYSNSDLKMQISYKSQTQETQRNNISAFQMKKKKSSQESNQDYNNKQSKIEPDKLAKIKTAQIFDMERVGLKIKYRKNQKNIVNRGHALKTLNN